MTPQEKRNKTLAEKEARYKADKNDYTAALCICRAIRDDKSAATSDRLMAIQLILELKQAAKIKY